MNGDPRLYQILDELEIPFDYHEHPAVPTVEEAIRHWKGIDSTHCKNLFFRNHKGNRHYLVILEHTNRLAIRDLEQMLKQGKLSLGSDRRLEKYMGLTPGSVSPFGLINDSENHVHIFIDEKLKTSSKLSFHPNINTATLVIAFDHFMKFMEWSGNTYEFINLAE
ncbi:MAG: prolyl-tRNA synthetase associated domain-containing protein [Bacteroidales bacterium]|nr:prolyl-tRNA synthetase associated domain-containing protein [Bacteroidales bacterium]